MKNVYPMSSNPNADAAGRILNNTLIFALDFLLSPDITNEKVSMGMIVFGCMLIGWGYKKQNVRID